MKIYELAAIAARIFAICLFLLGLRQFGTLAGYIGPISSDEVTVPLVYFLLTVLVPIVIAIAIWKFPITISRAVLPQIRSEEIKISEGNTFLPAAFIVLGVYILSYAIPDLVFYVTRFYMAYRMELTGVEFEMGIESNANFVATIVEIFIALWLILGSSAVKMLITKLRGREV